MPKQIIAVDSQILKSYELCARKCKFTFVDKIIPLVKKEYYDRGDIIHFMLKDHYKILRHNFLQNGRQIPYQEIMKICVRRGERHALTLDLDAEECLRAIKTYEQYAQYYSGENWIPLHIEQAFSKVLYDSDDLQVLYQGRVDLMITQGIVDHKSSEKRGEPGALDEQFYGYCWAFNCHNLIVNKIGFQKTLPPEEKFERYTKSYPSGLIEEWQEHATDIIVNGLYPDVRDAVRLDMSDRMAKRFNLTSCYGCMYALICNTEPEARLWVIQSKYKLADDWEPAKVLEGA